MVEAPYKHYEGAVPVEDGVARPIAYHREYDAEQTYTHLKLGE